MLRRWAEVLDDLAIDPMRCADRLDWPAKLRLLEGYRSRDGLAWGDSRLQLVDLQYSDVRPDKGLYNRLVARGSMQRLLTDDEVTRAMPSPPSDTRAFFRGECLRRYPAQVAAASWDSVVFDLGRENLVRIPTMEPLRGTREHVGALFEASATAAAARRHHHRIVIHSPAPDDPDVTSGGYFQRSTSHEHDRRASMATRDTGGQQKATRTREETDEVEASVDTEVAERHKEMTEDVDSLLDEIDEVLEENAEEFVRQYVQKGGQ